MLVPRYSGKSSWEQYRQVFAAIVCSNGWDGVTAALQLISHLEVVMSTDDVESLAVPMVALTRSRGEGPLVVARPVNVGCGLSGPAVRRGHKVG